MTTPDIRTTTLSKIRGYDAANLARTRLRQLAQLAIPQLATGDDLRTGIDNYLAGADIDIIALAESEQQRLTSNAARLALGDIVKFHPAGQRESRKFTADQVAPALEHLDGELTRVIEEVREVDRILGRLTNLQDAARAGHASTWTTLTDLTGRYDEIRSLQREITLTHHDYTNTTSAPQAILPLEMSGHLADALDREPRWIHLRTEYAVANGNRGNRNRNLTTLEESYVSWLRPDPKQGGGFTKTEPGTDVWPDQDAHAYLRWIATNAEPWVPTIDQLEDAYTAANAAIVIIQGSTPTSQWAGPLHRYYAITNTTPINEIPELAEAAR